LRVVGRAVVVEHQVERVAGGGEVEEFEDCVPGGVGEGPEYVWQGAVSRGVQRVCGEMERKRTEIACDVDEEVECL
jgi:hypothetical protein